MFVNEWVHCLALMRPVKIASEMKHVDRVLSEFVNQLSLTVYIYRCAINLVQL